MGSKCAIGSEATARASSLADKSAFRAARALRNPTGPHGRRLVSTSTLQATVCALQAAPAFARGVGIGCTAHVGGMAALAASGDLAAADAAACALVVVGVARAVLMQVPAFSRALAHACGGHGGGSAEIAARTHPPRDT